MNKEMQMIAHFTNTADINWKTFKMIMFDCSMAMPFHRQNVLGFITSHQNLKASLFKAIKD